MIELIGSAPGAGAMLTSPDVYFPHTFDIQLLYADLSPHRQVLLHNFGYNILPLSFGCILPVVDIEYILIIFQ